MQQLNLSKEAIEMLLKTVLEIAGQLKSEVDPCVEFPDLGDVLRHVSSTVSFRANSHESKIVNETFTFMKENTRILI